LAYRDAKGKSNEGEMILQADLKLLEDISKMDWSLMDTKEKNYAFDMAAAFAIKIAAYDVWVSDIESAVNQAKEYFNAILSMIPTSNEYVEPCSDQFGDSFSVQIDDSGNYILSCDNSAYGEDVAIRWTLDATWSSVKANIINGYDWLFDQIDKFNPLRSLFTTASSVAVPRRDPLILDLDGDGTETIGVEAGAYFDHDANGFAEQTGWVSPDDGLLVLDRNNDGVINNGRELFGDNTLLKNGSLATDGLQALADLDSNGDKKIDANDAAFSQLKVWKDTNSDGISTANELHTLNELNIKSLNTTYTTTNITDPSGNTQTHAATYEKLDGSIGLMGNFLVQRDTGDTRPTETLPVPEGDISTLPDMQGYGNVYDLQQAMIRDESGQLKALVVKFIETTDTDTRNSLMEQILFKWTGSEGIDPNSRGGLIDARKLAVLEKFFGQTYTGTTGTSPHAQAVPFLMQSYKGVYEMFYSQIMAQTHLKDLYGAINYTWDDATQSVKGDLSAVITGIQSQLSTNYETGKQALFEFTRTLVGFQALDMMNVNTFRTAFASQSDELSWIIDSAGKSVILGTAGNDYRVGAATGDAIKGDAGNDALYGNNGDDVIYGNQGDDYIDGGAGSDILDGGAGNDTLIGYTGSDTYKFGIGSGTDSITDTDTTGNTDIDTIEFGAGITSADVEFAVEGLDLRVKIAGASDSLKIANWFNYNSKLVFRLGISDRDIQSI
jgi:hypothetical protein